MEPQTPPSGRSGSLDRSFPIISRSASSSIVLIFVSHSSILSFDKPEQMAENLQKQNAYIPASVGSRRKPISQNALQGHNHRGAYLVVVAACRSSLLMILGHSYATKSAVLRCSLSLVLLLKLPNKSKQTHRKTYAGFMR